MFAFFSSLRIGYVGQVSENEASGFGTRIAEQGCPVAKEPAVQLERIELHWKQFEGKKKYLYWNSVEAGPSHAGDGEKTAEDIQQERDAGDTEARRRGPVRP
jgi:hypothetical protein